MSTNPVETSNHIGKWSVEEDKRLVGCMLDEPNRRPWKTVAGIVATRNPKQCRERWSSHLSPNVNTEEWTLKEEESCLELHQMYGRQWSRIARELGTARTACEIKNRFMRKGKGLKPPAGIVKQPPPQALPYTPCKRTGGLYMQVVPTIRNVNQFSGVYACKPFGLHADYNLHAINSVLTRERNSLPLGKRLQAKHSKARQSLIPVFDSLWENIVFTSSEIEEYGMDFL